MPRTFEFPGFVDVHVHFRDPGMTTAETTASGAAAARKGGFAAVVTMPNTVPAGDNERWIRAQAEDASLPVRIIPSACITRGRLGVEVSPLEQLAEAGAAFFTDDGSYVADDAVMEEAMKRAADLGMVVCDHALIPSPGVLRDCALARKFSLPVIPASAEIDAVSRDISLCRVTGCRLHIQHISTAGAVELVRAAQKEGLPVTAEATPHHLLFACDDLEGDDAAFKMAPPLGNREDRAELRRAVKDGILMFATDHAPHPAQTKSGGFLSSANGIVGLETAIPVTYAVMVEEEGMDVEAWARAWWEMPRWIVAGSSSITGTTRIRVDEANPRTVDVSSFVSLSRNCPYGGMEFSCWPEEVTI